MKNLLSKCCKAELDTACGGEGTCCYVCKKCGKPCDPIGSEKIKSKSETYKENSLSQDCFRMNPENPYEYEPKKGEKINVVFWVRYPSYDFIFGLPDKTNPFYKKEFGFFQFRDTRAKEIRQGFYVDQTELEEMVDGFQKIFSLSREKRLKEWSDYDKKNGQCGY